MESTVTASASRFVVVACLVTAVMISSHARLARAYKSESMPRPQRRSVRRREVKVEERPLAPPFPNGPCGGSVLTIPSSDLFPEGNGGGGGIVPFLDFDPLERVARLGRNALLAPRDVKVWLPREYDLEAYRGHRFHVLYCHDGQNAMEDASSWTGSSWRLVGALTRLSERGMLRTAAPPIVVCIPCGEGGVLPGVSRRHGEYGDYAHPMSIAHGDFVARALHPYVMGRFRVGDGPEYAATMGSSLGGQASMQLLLRYPEIFGGAACMSPCFQPGTIAAAAMASVASASEEDGSLPGARKGISGEGSASNNKLRSRTIYIDNGGDVDDARVPVFEMADHFTMNERWWNPGYWWLDTSLQPMVDAMLFTLDQQGLGYTYEKFPGGRHNERGWAQRIHRPLLALYGKQ